MINLGDHSISMTLGVAIGGIISKILAHRQKREEMQHDEASSIRKELRDDVAHLQEKIDKISQDLDIWKDRYYKLADENVQLKARCKTLEVELEELSQKVTAQTHSTSSQHPEDPNRQMQ